MAKDANSILLCLVVAGILHFGTATMIPETTKVKVCSNNGSYTLSPWLEYLGKSNFAAIDVSWNRGNTDSSNWTNLFHLRDSICSMSKESSADCTWLRCSSDGKLIADHSGGRPTMKSARYLLEARLSNGSHVHHFYDVEFIECLKTWIGASINLIDKLVKLLPNAWKRGDDVFFYDSNNTKIAYCRPGRCSNLISVDQISNPWLHWTSRLNDSGGKLELTRIEESDNLRDIRVTATLRSSTSGIGIDHVNIPLRILVESSQGSTTPHPSTLKRSLQSSFTSASEPSTQHVVTGNTTSPTNPTWPTNPTSPTSSSSANWRSRIVIVVLLLAVTSFLSL